MSKSKKKRTAPITHAGRVTITECKVRGKGLPCAPINRLTLYEASGKVREHCTCSCGRRFPITDPAAPDHLVEPAGPPTGPPEPGAGATFRMDEVEDAEATNERAAVGVVPIGAPVLHRPTAPVGEITPEVKALAKHMVKVMLAAPGVGLAANQVGVGLRLFTQIHKRAAPETVVDPVVRATSGTWEYSEGCLSVRVDDTQALLERPARIQVRAGTIHGDVVEITAAEVVGRIFQHEIDHLDGITYVQRITGDRRDEVMDTLEADGADTSSLTPRPY